MGADIHSYCEVKKNGKWELSGEVFPLDEWTANYRKQTHTQHPWFWRNYAVFGFLADVRNYSECPVIQAPVPALPADATAFVREDYEDWYVDAHSLSVLTLKQILDYDYEQKFWDRRITREEKPGLFNGAARANEGEGQTISLREHLGAGYFSHLDVMRDLAAPEDVRVIFWFDN